MGRPTPLWTLALPAPAGEHCSIPHLLPWRTCKLISVDSGQTEVDTAQAAVNAAATELANTQTAKTNAASAPVTMIVSFLVTNSTPQKFTSTTQWQAAVATYNQAVTTAATKDGAYKAVQASLATAQATQTTLVLRC